MLPREICPVDGTVLQGHGVIDEAYLTGEPDEISKTPGSMAISGAVNGEALPVIRAERLAEDSRCARIMKVMHQTEQQRPRSAASAIIGAISLAARRAIIIKNPAVLEQIEKCQTLIFDKIGTLTYGRPTLTEMLCADGVDRAEVLQLPASLEQYSKHPLASAIVLEANQQRITALPVDQISERPGEGLRGELMHIARRMRRIALHSALGGMAASVIGMIPAAFGFLPPIGGAVGQELIDLLAALNAARVALPSNDLQDF